MASNQVQVAVIGAGVIGLAVARALAMKGKEVLILERASSFGSETSARNSEVIHAGLYYPSSSFKAKFCVQGKQLLYEYCKSRHVPYNRCGKLVVATHKEQQLNDNDVLVKLKNQAETNGVHDVRLLSSDDVKVLEPEIECVVGALWSPSTGVLDSHTFMMNLLGDAEAHGAMLALQSSVQRGTASMNGGMIQLVVNDMELECDTVINCAGLWADEVATCIQMPSTTTSWTPPRQYFAKGNYFHLEGIKKAPFHHLVYPAPDPTGAGLGVHATMDWSGQSVRFGPDVEWIHPAKRLEDVDLTPDPARGEAFYDAVRTYWPALPNDALVPDYAGIRPKLHHPNVVDSKRQGFMDFRIDTKENHGIPGLIHLFGMESPGLTASMAIAQHVANLVEQEDS